MRAGKLDREITLDAYSDGVPDEYGNATPGYTPFAEVRAQIITMSTEEFMRAFGEMSQTAIVFRIRFMDGITTSDRVGYDGRHFNIKEIKEIGRRKGLELRCEEVQA